MFEDEAGFGRINKPKYCWCEKGIRPSVPCHHIREYRYVYGAVEPLTGDSCFLVMPYCNTDCMNIFLLELSKQFKDDVVLLCCDGAAWHNSKTLEIPENIVLFHIPPYTPEMNPIEQIWKEIRKMGFRRGIQPLRDRAAQRPLRQCDGAPDEDPAGRRTRLSRSRTEAPKETLIKSDLWRLRLSWY